MKILKTVSHLTNAELKEVLNKQTSIRAYKDWQVIYSVQTNSGKKAEEFSSILGVEKSKIYRIIQLYNSKGVNWRNDDNWGGRREKRCIMDLEEEKSLLDTISGEALSGKVLIHKHIKKRVEEKAGKEVSDDYIWDLFKRHGWTKKVPRQMHPKGDKLKQEEFKKNSKRSWQPSP